MVLEGNPVVIAVLLTFPGCVQGFSEKDNTTFLTDMTLPHGKDGYCGSLSWCFWVFGL